MLHGVGSVELRLRLTRDRLVVETEDGTRDLPRRRRARADEESGRGLQLVACLADRWGARRSDDGKVVWAELDLAVPRQRPDSARARPAGRACAGRAGPDAQYPARTSTSPSSG